MSEYYQVVDVQYDDNTRTDRVLFKGSDEESCWRFIFMRLINPNKAEREQAKKLFVFDPTNAMVFNMPEYIRNCL